MACQLLHVASGFALHAKVLQQMQPGMHYLRPVTRALRERVPMLAGRGDYSLLLTWYTLLEVWRPTPVDGGTAPTRLHQASEAVSILRRLNSVSCVLQQLLIGVLLPFLLFYTSQLRNRRRWRKLHLRRLGHPPRPASQYGGPAASPAEQAHPELSILPVWTLHLPQAVLLLSLSFAAGQGAELLFYMV